MRTCRICGCYIPDGWTECPSCHDSWIKIRPSTKPKCKQYKVIVLTDPHHGSHKYFEDYHEAMRYANTRTIEPDLFAVEVVYNGRIVKFLQLN